MNLADKKGQKLVEKIVKKAEVLTEALPHIQKFRDSTIVIKYGGSAMMDEAAERSIIRDFVTLETVGVNPVIVHGGGPEITALMGRMGLRAEFHQGQRVTDAQTLEITEMALNGKLNGEIVSMIHAAGGRAVGLSGKDGKLIVARKHQEADGRDMGYVGDVEAVHSELLELLISRQFIPVVSPIGADEAGQTYNINADFVAAEVAAALKARKLVLVTDVRGIMRDPSDESSLMESIRADEIESLIAEGAIQGGMIPKARACLRAIQGGVGKAHILDGRLHHSLLIELFTDAGIGTEIQ